MSQSVFFGENFADRLYGLVFITLLDAKIDGLLREDEDVQDEDDNLERDLYSEYASPPLSLLQLRLLLWHTNCHQQQCEVEQLHQYIGRCSKAFVE